MVDSATPVDLDDTVLVVITELPTEPSAAVEKDVNVVGTVVDSYNADVTTVSDERVARSMVEEPTTTTSEVRERVLVDCEVTVEPALLVVVISIVVGVADVDCCSDVVASDVGVVVSSADVVGVVASVVGVVSAAVVVSDVTGAEVVVSAVVGSAADVVDIVDDSSVVEEASVVELVTPVPTTCRLGMMPAGMLSAPICENPKKSENMMVNLEFCGNICNLPRNQSELGRPFRKVIGRSSPAVGIE